MLFADVKFHVVEMTRLARWNSGWSECAQVGAARAKDSERRNGDFIESRDLPWKGLGSYEMNPVDRLIAWLSVEAWNALLLVKRSPSVTSLILNYLLRSNGIYNREAFDFVYSIYFIILFYLFFICILYILFFIYFLYIFIIYIYIYFNNLASFFFSLYICERETEKNTIDFYKVL